MENAKDQLTGLLLPYEKIDYIIFSTWTHYSDKPKKAIPADHIGVILPWDDISAGLMEGWSANGGYGCEKVYPFYAWSSILGQPSRVFFIQCYDGSTCIVSVPRFPDGNAAPKMVGGG